MVSKRGLARFQCPGCGALGVIREIAYGMPGEDFDFDRYIVGGCCVTDNDPEIGCVKCGWEGSVPEILNMGINQTE